MTFVPRPSPGRDDRMISLLKETLRNGKAVPLAKKNERSARQTVYRIALQMGARGHLAKQPDGTFIAWLERKNGGRP